MLRGKGLGMLPRPFLSLPSNLGHAAGRFSLTRGKPRCMLRHKKFRMKAQKFIVLTLLAILLSSVFACGSGEEEPTPTPTPEVEPCVPQVPIEGQANLFRNPGLESGEDPWCSIHPPKFEVSQNHSHSGQSSALLQMQASPETTGAKVYYLVQEVAPQEFPEFISGYCRVEKWTKGTPKQYLQFVVITFGAINMPGGFPNHQIRYPLAGISEDPFAIGNAFFVFIGREEPRIGQWVYFERNIKQDFQDLWGAVPEEFSKIRVLFEVRFDDKETGAAAEAEVYYDDLYLGPASENPNRPD